MWIGRSVSRLSKALRSASSPSMTTTPAPSVWRRFSAIAANNSAKAAATRGVYSSPIRTIGVITTLLAPPACRMPVRDVREDRHVPVILPQEVGLDIQQTDEFR